MVKLSNFLLALAFPGALGLTITVDSAQPGYEGAKAIDSDKTTIWHSKYTDALPHSAVIDVGSAIPLNGLTYLPRQDVPAGGQIYGNIGQYKVEVSTDNTQWSVVATGTFVDDATLKTASFSGVTARYLRLTAITEAGNRGPWTSAAELGLSYASNARPLSITVDSAQSGNEGTKAIDGDKSTIWHTRYSPDNAALPHNAVIDFGSTTSVKGFTYLPRQDVPDGGKIYGNIGQYRIETSTDNTSWAVQATGTFVNDKTLKVTNFASTSARYIRIVALTEAGNNGPWTSAAEFAVLFSDSTVPSVSSLPPSSTAKPTSSVPTTSSVAPSSPTTVRPKISITVDSFQPGNEGTKAVDGDTNTFWHTKYSPDTAALPHNAVIDLGLTTSVSGFTYLPRQDVPDGGKIYGNIGQYRIETSTDNTNWAVQATGTFANDKTLKVTNFASTSAQYIRIVALTEAGNNGPWTSAAEFAVLFSDSTVSSVPSTPPSSTAKPVSVTTTSSAAPSSPTAIRPKISITVDSFQPGNEGTKAVDGDTNTFWHTRYSPDNAALPHNAVLDLGSPPMLINTVSYLPRQDVPDGGKIYGHIGQYTVETSTDNNQWTTVASGAFTSDKTLKKVTFPGVTARYIRFTALTEADNSGPWTCAAEFGASWETIDMSGGRWGSVIQLPLVPAAGILLPTSGKVLVFSSFKPAEFGSTGNTITAIFDPATGSVTQRNVAETNHDMFCPGMSLDFNGRAIVTGGDDSSKTSIYDPASNGWSAGALMQLARGYQTSATLSDGRIFTIGGSWVSENLRGGKIGEVYDTSKNTWTTLPGCLVNPMLTNDAQGIFRADNHGWLFSWKGGFVFQAGPSRAMNWYGTTGTGSQSGAGQRAADGDSMNGNAVMFDAVNGKIFTAGGSPSYQTSTATNNVHLITIGEPGTTPSVRKLTSMSYARAFGNSVVLPDGKIFVTGGQSYAAPFSDAQAIMTPELWDPSTESFKILPPHSIPRTYHSIALLMLDGTVFTGGGGLCGTCATNHLDAQIYTPGYLLNKDGSKAVRPVIQSADTVLKVGATFTAVTDSVITGWSLIRYGSATHTVNSDQRRIALTASATSGNSYTLKVPSDAGVALPGYWMLFALNAAGVPSVATTVKITL